MKKIIITCFYTWYTRKSTLKESSNSTSLGTRPIITLPSRLILKQGYIFHQHYAFTSIHYFREWFYSSLLHYFALFPDFPPFLNPEFPPSAQVNGRIFNPTWKYSCSPKLSSLSVYRGRPYSRNGMVGLRSGVVALNSQVRSTSRQGFLFYITTIVVNPFFF